MLVRDMLSILCLRLLQNPKVVAAPASYSHTGNGGKARGRKDIDKGGGQRPRGGQRASSSATSAPMTGTASIQFFCGKRDMAPAPRACSTQSAANARPAVVQHIEEIPSHAAAQARQRGVSRRKPMTVKIVLVMLWRRLDFSSPITAIAGIGGEKTRYPQRTFFPFLHSMTSFHKHSRFWLMLGS
jgi:hypothetical protein